MNRFQNYLPLCACIYIAIIWTNSWVVSQHACDLPIPQGSQRNNYDITSLSAAGSQADNLFITRYHHQRRLSSDTFARFQQLQHLSISCNLEAHDCEPLHVDSGLLEPIKETMTYLGLSHNSIGSLPEDCFCGFSKLEKLVLSYNAIGNVAQLGFGDSCRAQSDRKPLVCLALDHNQIVKVPTRAFRHLRYLQFLSLAANQISEIEPGAFDGLFNLSTIILHRNQLRTLPDSLFQNLTLLTKLDLQLNQLVALPLFPELPNLAYLYINDNGLTSLPNLTSLSSLYNLTLRNNKIVNITRFSDHMPRGLARADLCSNRITVITEETFSKHVNIARLNLSNNSITHIAPGAFESNRKLRKIHISNNQLETLAGLLDTVPFQELDASYNNIHNFTYPAPNVTFRMLNLSHNHIDAFSFNPQARKVTPAKVTIDLSFNKLANHTTLPIPSIVNEIWLNDNAIESIDTYSLDRSRQLRTLYLHNNAIRTFCEYLEEEAMYVQFNPPATFVTLGGNPLVCSCETEWIKRRTNKVLVINDVESLMCKSHYPRSSATSYLKDTDYFLCGTEATCPPPIIGGAFQCLEGCHCYDSRSTSFIFVDCSRKNLTEVPNQQLRADILHVFMDGNSMPHLHMSSFSNMATVEVLYLNGSHIEDFHRRTFEPLTALAILHLGGNRLKTIPEKAFLHLVSLQELYMDHNQLLRLDAFGDMDKLGVLELHNNQLTTYPVWTLASVATLRSITLQDNPWSCSCEYMEEFQEWLLRASNIVNKENLSCVDESNDRRLVYKQFDECTEATNQMSTWASVAGVASIMVILGVLLFVYIREVQVLVYSRYGVRLARRTDGAMDADKEFDIFVSYSSKDEDFLVGSLLPNLEDIDPPYSVCLHDRDFLAGGYISENIMSAIDRCRRTVILLSEDFVQSEWCRFEFKMAHTKMLEDKCTRMVVIIKDKVPENMDPVLLAYLRTNTYLTWGERLFWKKLYFALPKPTQQPLQEAVESGC